MALNVSLTGMNELPKSTPKKPIRDKQFEINIVIIIIIVAIPVAVLIAKSWHKIESEKDTQPITTTNVTAKETTTVLINITDEHAVTPSLLTLNDDLLTNPIKIIGRVDWFAQKPFEHIVADELKHPVKNILITHSATKECLSAAACMFRVRTIQKLQQRETLYDIKSNFLIGGDGGVYEGRGWDIQGGHTNNQNVIGISIAIIGDFNETLPSGLQIDVVQRLITFGVQIEKIDRNYVVYPDTENPSIKLDQVIKNWPHYYNP